MKEVQKATEELRRDREPHMMQCRDLSAAIPMPAWPQLPRLQKKDMQDGEGFSRNTMRGAEE